MLATGLITGQLAAGLKQKAREAELREQRTQALYEVARHLAGALTLEQVTDIARQFIRRQFAADAALLLQGRIRASARHARRAGFQRRRPARPVASDSGEAVRRDEYSGDGHASLYLPLRASMRTRGVLAVAFGRWFARTARGKPRPARSAGLAGRYCARAPALRRCGANTQLEWSSRSACAVPSCRRSRTTCGRR
jgi:K+-sensing histidine kinase KdpD